MKDLTEEQQDREIEEQLQSSNQNYHVENDFEDFLEAEYQNQLDEGIENLHLSPGATERLKTTLNETLLEEIIELPINEEINIDKSKELENLVENLNTVDIDQNPNQVYGIEDTGQDLSFKITLENGEVIELGVESPEVVEVGLNPKTKTDLEELKNVIDKNLSNIKNIEVTNGKNFHKKIPLRDFIKKELNATDYNSNGEKMGENLIMSLIKPLKVYNHYLNQDQKEKLQEGPKKENTVEKETLIIKVNDKNYNFISYSDDFKKITIEDETGKRFNVQNNISCEFTKSPKKEFNSIELNLLNKGNVLIEKEKQNPFKIKINEEGTIVFKTITENDFLKNIQKEEKNPLEKEIKKSSGLSIK